MWSIGLDWHLGSSTAWILDEHGKKVKHLTVRGHWRKMVERLKTMHTQHEQQMAIVIEASCGYGVLHDELNTFATRVVVAHPGQLRLIFRSKQKHDRADAQKLATLLYLDQVPEVHVPNVDVRAWRELIEFRRSQVDHQTKLKNQVRALLRSYGVQPTKPGKWLWTVAGQQWFGELDWRTSTVQARATLLILQLQQAKEAIQTVTRELDQILKQHAGAALLQSTPGVGPRTAEALLAHIDQRDRFARINRLGAYFGLVPTQDASGQTNRLGHITKQGPATARKLLIEATWQFTRHSPAAKAVFERISQGKKDRRKIALVAVAHKLLRTLGAMLRTGEAWNEQHWADTANTTPATA